MEIFAKRIGNLKAEKVPRTIAASCIVHNIYTENGRPDTNIDNSDDDDDSDDDLVYGEASINAGAVRDL